MAKKKKKKISSTFLIVIGFFFIWGGILLIKQIQENTYKVHVNVDSEAQVNVPTNFSFTITKKGKEYSPEEVHLNIHHIYDSESEIDITIPPYDIGQYQLLITPEKSGQYDWVITFSESSKVYEGNFTI